MKTIIASLLFTSTLLATNNNVVTYCNAAKTELQNQFLMSFAKGNVKLDGTTRTWFAKCMSEQVFNDCLKMEHTVEQLLQNNMLNYRSTCVNLYKQSK